MKNSVKRNGKNCLLLFDNGNYTLGKGAGLFGNYIGEICFNTSITGYQEILTDPSYYNQIINFTFPHVGIVGTNFEDYESDKIYASGCIINNDLSEASNYRSKINLNSWLKSKKIGCITGLDTRVLTKQIRRSGVSKALIHYPKKGVFDSLKKLKLLLNSFPEMNGTDLASKVTTQNVYVWKKKQKHDFKGKGQKRKFIAVIDFGIKNNILNILSSFKYDVIVFPISYPIKEILSMKPEGIFLSNGPGDPKATFRKYQKNFNLIKTFSKPVFGICLGHQILSLIFNAQTEKMHHGHRGANHPIKNEKTKKVEITVQNHGFVVSKKKFPKTLKVTHSSLFDKTIAGIEVRNKPFFSVQYHPESSPGPQDSRYLFDQFFNLMNNA
ncbi:MAG: hypothetical protein CBC25_06520 [Pelagibacteraceae bacterium TMED65]|nr:carbamoyl phosphate synthase small subunit [Rickettsiales bacterium]OUU51072.1 MAG: hypothetical protein CBC25_06520 [Pelagibacteraceae bacterium TMED65]|tara:strand:- start:5581 stop:6729 length:1149 start_codon:yes stop_codon:yes gene_type:complete